MYKWSVVSGGTSSVLYNVSGQRHRREEDDGGRQGQVGMNGTEQGRLVRVRTHCYFRRVLRGRRRELVTDGSLTF